MYERNAERTQFRTVTVLFTGTGGHSSVPYKTKNPILAACRTIALVNEKVLYEFDSFQNVALVPLALSAGTKQNIIPDTATLVLRAEADTPENTARLAEVITATLAAVGAQYQVSAQISYGEVAHG